MKKYMKFIRTLIATLLVVVMSFGAIACGGSGSSGDNGGGNGGGGDNGGGSVTITPLPPSEGGTTESAIALGRTSLDLYVGMIFEPLTSSTAGVTWTSLDPNVATVKPDAKGDAIIEAINEGTTKIVAQYGRASATCDVNVTFDESLPELKVKNLTPDSDSNTTFATQTLSKGATFMIEPIVVYRNREFSDATFTYSVNNPSVGSVSEDGLLTINQNVPVGSTISVTVTGSWRGKTVADSPILKQIYTFGVLDEVFIQTDGINFNEFEIYLTDSFENQTFVNTAGFTTKVIVNNRVDENAEVTREISNPELLEYNSNTNVYTGKKFGSGTITLTYNFDNGTEVVPVTTQVAFRVLRPTATMKDTVNYFSGLSGATKDDRASGQLVDKTLAQFIYGLDTTKTIIDAELVNELLTPEQRVLKVEDNKVLGLDYATDKVVDRKIQVGFEDCIWYLDLKVYGQYITKASDFDVFVLNKANPKVNAYVELGCNVDASSFVMREHFVGSLATDPIMPNYLYSEGQALGFTGVFQGNGYTVTGLSTGIYGLFGCMSNATLKNVAFKNCNIFGAAFLTMNMNKCSLENVYISVESMSRASEITSHVVAGHRINQGSFKNFVIENSQTNAVASDAKFAFAPLYTPWMPTFENVIVISGLYLGGAIKNSDVKNFAFADNQRDDTTFEAMLDFMWEVYDANNASSRNGFFNTYKSKTGDTETDPTKVKGSVVFPVINQVELDTSKPSMFSYTTGLNMYSSMDAFVADEQAQAIAKLFNTTYWTIEEGKIVWGASNVKANEGEIFIHLGDRANKPVSGMTTQRIKASAGTVELPALSSSGYVFQGYEVVGTGVKITKNGQGKYLFEYDGSAVIVRALWKKSSTTTTTPIF